MEDWKEKAEEFVREMRSKNTEEIVSELRANKNMILGVFLVLGLAMGSAMGYRYWSVTICVLIKGVVEVQKQREKRKNDLPDVTINNQTSTDESSFVTRLRMLDDAEWALLTSGPPMEISTREFTLPSGKQVTGYRFEVLRPNVDATMVIKTLGDRSNWDKIDPNLEKVTQSKQNPAVFKIETRRIAMVSPRVAYVSYHVEEHETKHYVGFMGVQTEDFEPSSKIEATVWIDATIVERMAEGCRCVYYSVMDPKVWMPIPHAVATRIVSTRLENLEVLVRDQMAGTSGQDEHPNVSAPKALCATTLNHASWRSVSQEDFITMWQGSTKDTIRIRGSMFLKGNPVLLQKLVSLPTLQYELLPWLVKSDTLKSHGGIRYAEEVWRLPSPYFGTTTRKHSIRHYEAAEVDERLVVAMRSSESNRPGKLPNQVKVLPSGWVINSLSSSSNQSHVEFVIQFSYSDMPNSEYVSAWVRRRVQRMLEELRRLS